MCVVKLMILLIVYLASPFFLLAVVPSLRNLRTSHQIYLLANVLVNGFGPRASVVISDFVVINESYEVFFKSRGCVTKLGPYLNYVSIKQKRLLQSWFNEKMWIKNTIKITSHTLN